MMASSVGFFGGAPTKMMTLMSVSSSFSSTSRKNINVHLQKRSSSLKVNAHPSKIYWDMSKMQVGVNKLNVGGPKRQNLVLMSSKNGSPKTANNAIKEVEDRNNKYEEIGSIVDEAFSKVGREGAVVTLNGWKHAYDRLYLAEGMRFDRDFLSPYFVTRNGEEEMCFFDYEHCTVLLVDIIRNAKELAGVLEQDIMGGDPILIIAWDIQRETLDAIEAKRPLGAPKIEVLLASGFLDHESNYLDDIALLTGATVIREEDGLTLENVGSDVVGFAAKVVVADDVTTIVGDGRSRESLNREVVLIAEKIRELVLNKESALKINGPAKSVKEMYQEARLYEEIQRLDQRLMNLSQKVAVIEVGAETGKEEEEKKQRFDVAIDKVAKKARVDKKKALSCDNPKYGYTKLACRTYERLLNYGDSYEDLVTNGIVDEVMISWLLGERIES